VNTRALANTELQFRPLIAVHIVGGVEVPKSERCSTREGERLGVVTPLHLAHKPGLGPVHDGTRQAQVRIGPAQDECRVAGDIDVSQGRHQQGVRLATARRATVEHLEKPEVIRQQERRLMVRRGVRAVRYR
jgi:hypothetical protein